LLGTFNKKIKIIPLCICRSLVLHIKNHKENRIFEKKNYNFLLLISAKNEEYALVSFSTFLKKNKILIYNRV